MRDLFLVRHGKAVDSAPGGDPARTLTEEGREGIRRAGQGLKAFGLVPDVIVHSPYARALETAQILAAALGTSSLVAEGALTPSASPERAADALRRLLPKRVMAVSHMPLLPALALELVGARVDFGTGTVAHLAALGPHGTVLLGLWTADQLARVR